MKFKWWPRFFIIPRIISTFSFSHHSSWCKLGDWYYCHSNIIVVYIGFSYQYLEIWESWKILFSLLIFYSSSFLKSIQRYSIYFRYYVVWRKTSYSSIYATSNNEMVSLTIFIIPTARVPSHLDKIYQYHEIPCHLTSLFGYNCVCQISE